MFHDFINLFYPKICQICEINLINSEKVICTNCIHQLPVTNYHFHNDNPVKKVFYGRIRLEHATSLLIFKKKSDVQTLIHELKYKGQEEIGSFLGKWLGEDLKSLENYREIDLVIPVPLHPLKLKKRGYNQVSKFGAEIAHSLNVPFDETILIKKALTTSQTFKARISRYANIDETFILNPDVVTNLEKKHILLVDDLITTGATLESCAHCFSEIPGIKLSVASMAFTL